VNRLPILTRFVLGQLIGKGPLRDALSAHELDHALSTLRGNWLGSVVLCRAPVALGIIALEFFVVASLAVGGLLFLAGLAEALGAFDQQRVTVRPGMLRNNRRNWNTATLRKVG
jgi:hypothetical protein